VVLRASYERDRPAGIPCYDDERLVLYFRERPWQAQGDAEVCGVAAKIPTSGVLSVDLIKGRTIGTPRVESEDYIMTVGSARPMEDAARIAFYELVMWLESDYGMDRLLAYQLCSQIARVRLANMVDILYSVVAKYPKSHLPA
jgi:amidase